MRETHHDVAESFSLIWFGLVCALFVHSLCVSISDKIKYCLQNQGDGKCGEYGSFNVNRFEEKEHTHKYIVKSN